MATQLQRWMAQQEKDAKNAGTADKGKGAPGDDRRPNNRPRKRRDDKHDAGRVSDGARDLRVPERPLAQDAGLAGDGARSKDDRSMAKRTQRTAAQKPARAAEGEETVRLIFPAPKSLADQIEAEWHKRKLKSLSATIRALLEEALA